MTVRFNMKKLLTIVGLALALMLSPTKTQAGGGCSMSWQGNQGFFNGLNYVVVYQAAGGQYTVNWQNFNPSTQYPLAAGDQVMIYRYSGHTNCYQWTWGYFNFCECLAVPPYIECPPPAPLTLGNGVLYEKYEAYLDCHCPTNPSHGGLSLIQVVNCF